MNSQDSKGLLADIAAQYGEDVQVIGELEALMIEPQRLLNVLEFLKNNEAYQCNMLRNLTAVDYLEYMELVYHLYSLPLKHMITVKTRTGMEDLVVPSVTSLWPAAEFQEREVYDLLGVKFTGHPDLRRILLPEEFPGNPLRKTYNTANTGEKR